MKLILVKRATANNDRGQSKILVLSVFNEAIVDISIEVRKSKTL